MKGRVQQALRRAGVECSPLARARTIEEYRAVLAHLSDEELLREHARLLSDDDLQRELEAARAEAVTHQRQEEAP